MLPLALSTLATWGYDRGASHVPEKVASELDRHDAPLEGSGTWNSTNAMITTSYEAELKAAWPRRR